MFLPCSVLSVHLASSKSLIGIAGVISEIQKEKKVLIYLITNFHSSWICIQNMTVLLRFGRGINLAPWILLIYSVPGIKSLIYVAHIKRVFPLSWLKYIDSFTLLYIRLCDTVYLYIRFSLLYVNSQLQGRDVYILVSKFLSSKFIEMKPFFQITMSLLVVGTENILCVSTTFSP